MKNIKAIGLLLLALIIGLAAAVYAAGWVSRQGGVAANKVVVARPEAIDLVKYLLSLNRSFPAIAPPAAATAPVAPAPAKP